MSSEAVAVREVDVRSWPERVDLLVVDAASGRALTHYPVCEGEGAVWDPRTPYADRLADALKRSEGNQQYLREFYGLPEGTTVRLQPAHLTRDRIETLLSQHGLALGNVELDNLRGAVEQLKKLDLDELYELLCDWYDVVERSRHAGSAQANPLSWVHRAAPDRACYFHFVAVGLETPDEPGDEDSDLAYREFLRMVDVDLESFTLGHLLRWVYFHRSEFPARRLPAMQVARVFRPQQ